jgi:LuxR family maltose regulon positive regulatory protein
MPTAVLARRLAVDVHVFIHCGDLDAAETLLQDGLCAESADVLSARVRVAIERGDTTGARIVLRAWPQEPLPRARREWQLWTAVLEHLDGNEAGARAAMASVVAEAEAEGDLALFRTAGNSVLGPARALFRRAPTAFLRAIVEQPVAVAPARPAKGLTEQLTDREFMVLVHLPSRESNAEIAEKLGVSLNTVKTHLKHIYRKLEVVGRSEAVDVAERLHLL